MTVFCIFFIDQSVLQWMAAEEHARFREAGRLVTDVALAEYWFALALFSYVTGRWVRRDFAKLKSYGAHLFWALIISGVLVHLLKFGFGRQRPHRSETYESLVFSPLTTDWYFHSLPSGHTQVLFTVATVTALWLPRWWPAIFLTAGVLAFTRVMTLQHFPGDLVLGALVGYYGSWLSLTLWRRIER